MRNSLMLGALAALSTSIAVSAADISPKAPVDLNPSRVTVFDYSGFLLGANIGYGQTKGDASVDGYSATNNKPCYWKCGDSVPELFKGFGGWGGSKYVPLTSAAFPTGINGDADGFTVGIDGGVRKQVGKMVVGVLASWDYTNIRNGGELVPYGASFGTFKTRIKNIGTVVGEVGVAFGPLLIAAEGGFAWGTVNRSFSTGPVVVEDNATKTGWTVGGKIEHQLGSSGWSIYTKYRHVSLGSYSLPVTVSDGLNTYSNVIHGDNKVDQVTVGFHKAIYPF